tara:strand:+ start:448 stop:909 length:462 start_codon:yes stop_codon:yes gene_type:complete
MNHVRPACIADLQPLSELLNGYRVFYSQESDIQAARDFLQTRFALADSRLLVSDNEGVLEGFVQLYPTLSTVRVGPRWTLADLFVAPEARGKGIGRELMEAAANLAREQGVGQLTLNTQTHNHTAQALYESLNWQRNDAFYAYTLNLDDPAGT